MWRLLRLMIALCASIALLIIGSMVIGGRLYPDWSHDFGQLDVCGDSLCFMGITPGVTSWEDAKKILQPYGYEITSQKPEWIEGHTAQVQFSLYKSNIDSVDWFFLDYASFPRPVTLKAIVARFGTPCRIGVGDDSIEIFTVGYPGFAVGLRDPLGQGSSWVSDNSYNPGEAVHIYTETQADPRCNAPMVWHGFRSTNYYWNYLYPR